MKDRVEALGEVALDALQRMVHELIANMNYAVTRARYGWLATANV